MFRFRQPTDDDAAMLLDWRKQPDVTRYMFTDVDHGVEEQRAWLKRCQRRADFRHFVIEQDNRPVGYLSFSAIDRVNRHCQTGHYFGSPTDRRRLGGYMHCFIMDYCFDVLGMNKVVNLFMAGNDRVIRVQEILHYRPVGVYREHVFKYGTWHDVLVYELLKREWETHPRPFPPSVTLAAFPAE